MMKLGMHRFMLGVSLVAALSVLSCGPGGSEAPRVAFATAMPTSAPSAIALEETPTPPEPEQEALPTSTLPVATTQPTSTPRPSDTPPPSPSPSPSPAPSPAPSPSPSPSASPSPAPTPAATATAPVAQPITVANAHEMVLLDRLGTGAPQGLAWLPDGLAFAVAFQAGLGLYDAGTLQEHAFFPAYGFKAGLTASPDGRHAALIAGDGVQLWDLLTGQMVQTLEAPAGGTRTIAFGAGGQVLAVSGPEVTGDSSSESVAVWDITGVLAESTPAVRLLYRLDGFGTGVCGLAFSPGGEVLVTTRWYGSSQINGIPYLRLWDARTGEALPLQGDLAAAPDGLQHLAFTPDGRLLAGDEGFNIHIWDAATGQLLQTLASDSMLYSLALSADGKWLAAGSPDKVARVWDVTAGAVRTSLPGHTDGVTGVAFAPAGQATTPLLATLAESDGVQLWDVESGERIAARPPVGHTYSVEALAYGPDGTLLATASPDQTVWLWDAESGQPVRMLDAHGLSASEWCPCIWSLAFSPDGKTVATGSTDARVRLWDVSSGQLLGTSRPLSDLIHGLGFSPDGRRLAAGDSDGLLWIWDLADPLEADPVLALDAGGVIVSLSFDPAPSSPGERVLATGSGFGAIRIWDAGTGALVREMQGSNNSAHVVYSPDGGVLAAGESGWSEAFPVRLWDPESGELLQTFVGHAKDVSGLAFTPDGRVLASGDWGGTTRLWDAATGEQLGVVQQPASVKAVAFRPDGARLATAGFDGLIWIWGIP